MTNYDPRLMRLQEQHAAAAAAAAAPSGDQTPWQAAQTAYDAMKKVPQQQQRYNAEVDRRVSELAQAIDATDPDSIVMLQKVVGNERAKFAETADAEIPGHCRDLATTRKAEADRQVD